MKNSSFIKHSSENLCETISFCVSHAQFILVESNDAIREKRYMKRVYFNLGIDYLREMTKLFEAPRIRMLLYIIMLMEIMNCAGNSLMLFLLHDTLELK